VGFSALAAEFRGDGVFRAPFPRADGYKVGLGRVAVLCDCIPEICEIRCLRF
jgi:hypothetical protein